MGKVLARRGGQGEITFITFLKGMLMIWRIFQRLDMAVQPTKSQADQLAKITSEVSKQGISIVVKIVE